MKAKRLNWLAAILVAGATAWTASAFATAKVYVADEEADTVSVLDAASFKKVGTIRVGRGPHNIQVSPKGAFAWVTNNGARRAESEHKTMSAGEHATAERGEIWAIDTATDAVVAKVTVGKHPAHVVLTPDERFAYVTNGGENTVSVVDIEARRVVATISVGAYPHGIRISPDGKQAYVANLKGGTVSVIDTATRKQVTEIAAGKGPAQVGFTPDGRFAFVSLSQEDKIAVIDPAARRVVKKVSVGSIPIQVYATPDGRSLLVANQGTRKNPGNTVSVIDLRTFQTAKTIETGPGAHGVVVDRTGRYAYVTNIYASTVSVLDAKDWKVVATVPVGKGPNGVSIQP